MTNRNNAMTDIPADTGRYYDTDEDTTNQWQTTDKKDGSQQKTGE